MISKGVSTKEPRPSLWPENEPREVRAATLLLPGGKANSYGPTDPRQFAALRMRPFARALARAGKDHGLAVWTLGYRYRGYNDPDESPVKDAQWALSEMDGDLPVVLIGHSMGGRVALRVAGYPGAHAVIALAPWVPEGEPVEQLQDREILIAHGTRDFVTSANESLIYARRAREAGVRVGRIRVPYETHAMLFRPRLWKRLVTGFTLGALGLEGMPPAIAAAMDRGREGNLDSPL